MFDRHLRLEPTNLECPSIWMHDCRGVATGAEQLVDELSLTIDNFDATHCFFNGMAKVYEFHRYFFELSIWPGNAIIHVACISDEHKQLY